MDSFLTLHLSDETFDFTACGAQPIRDCATRVSSNGYRADRAVPDRYRAGGPPTHCKSGYDEQAGRNSSDCDYSDA